MPACFHPQHQMDRSPGRLGPVGIKGSRALKEGDRGGIVRVMFRQRNGRLSFVLALAALVTLAGGPSPAAAFARYCDRLKQEQQQKRPPKHDLTSGQQARPPKQKSNAFTTFVAPRSAKPTEAKATDLLVDHPGRRCELRRGQTGWAPQPPTAPASRFGLHRPAYRATAPPVDDRRPRMAY